MITFDAGPVISGLKGFQQRTVEHVMTQFDRSGSRRRFLVSDETGLGKSLVARGVIARTIEKLQDEPGRKQINVVYVRSNSDLAAQNLSRLDVTGGRHKGIPSRLSLLAKYTRELQPDLDAGGVKVNLVSFTPGTSFHTGHQSGQVEERALVFLLLGNVIDLTGWNRHAALVLLRGQIGSREKFESHTEWFESSLEGPSDPKISKRFLAACKRKGLIARFTDQLERIGRKRDVPLDMADEVRQLISDMRGELARAGLSVLSPDLVILDEFQRFPDLLDASSPKGELADQLFSYPDTRVLLLSATPYKPFTYAEESGDDHHRDFLRTIIFLDADIAKDVRLDLADYRTAATQGRSVVELAARLRATLLQVMSRSERPFGVAGGMLSEHIEVVDDLSATDLLDYVALQHLSSLVKGDVSLEYWKSTPYFANFCDGYKLSEQLKTRLKGGDAESIRPAVRALSRLDPIAASGTGEVDLGNGKLRALARQTVDDGWWQLLWMPPSLPYLEPSGPYAEPWAQGITKRLVFSSWSATPTAIASLLSQRASRAASMESTREEGEHSGRRSQRSLLNYSVAGGRAESMTTLALFWPMPGLARRADPLAAAQLNRAPVGRAALEAGLTRELRSGTTKYGVSAVAEAARAAIAFENSLPQAFLDGGPSGRNRIIEALGRHSSADTDDATGQRGLATHVDEALELAREGSDVTMASVAPTVATLAAHSPGNIAWRALHRLAADHPTVTEAGLWSAAATVAVGFRSLFNRPDTIVLLEQLHESGAYWQKVLRYCAAGNLQAVMDEYLHHIASETQAELDDDSLMGIAENVTTALTLTPSTYRVFDPDHPDDPIRMTSRFALRYGGGNTDEIVRQPDVRRSFNSPFWPFVLASTSVGQEGIDFHWWCSAITHWNTPANPVDFEQREGRIDRFGGHAVRRNLAHRHGAAMLATSNPWRAAYELGKDEQAALGDFAPYWVYPGPAKIERHLSPYPLSVDVARLERLKSDLALYRLTFGQPRQEDMLALLRKRGLEAKPEVLAEMRIDLSPPPTNGASR
ncbi:Helicase domain protein [Rhodococcus sp. AW25M09]|uniref:helicase n=1 Tax=Rhodococcus sp. AW25M09 TaxID=1268303 RepID=UPI0002ACE141|nr:helicase [Rhodococcus sp. AW25M09]CCQ15623.1 Helicase domain protein [Rhodococcus sp. AW25M09]